MSHVVAVECDHRGSGDYWRQQEPTLVARFDVTPGREPRGFVLEGRVLIDGQRLAGDSRATKWRNLFAAAARSGHLPVVTHQLECECGQAARVPDLPMRRAMTRLAEQGGDSVPLRLLPGIV